MPKRTVTLCKHMLPFFYWQLSSVLGIKLVEKYLIIKLLVKLTLGVKKLLLSIDSV